MKFLVKKEELFSGLKMVEKATSQKGLQPVLGNILIETLDKSAIKLSATDLDLTIITSVEAQIEEEGKITLPARKLSDMIARVEDKLISFEMDNSAANIVKIECDKTKFELLGISADEFPAFADYIELEEEYCIEIEPAPFVKAIKQAGFAAAGYESNNLLSGIVCSVSEKTLEIASTDGNRLARIRETIENKENKSSQLIIPSRTLNEFVKMGFGEDIIKLYNFKSRMVLKTEKVMMISRLLEGSYPKYNQLIPQQSPKEATINIENLIVALERVSVMVNEKTHIIKFEFNDNKLTLKADTPESGKSEDEIEIDYAGEELVIAFNYKYVLDGLKNMDAKEVTIGLNTPLSATVLKPKNEEDYVCLVMPVQIR